MFDGDALTAEEVAEMLRVSKNSVYRLAQSGELASYRVGRKLRFTLRDVEAYTRSGMRSQKGAQTWQSASSVWRRSCPASPSSPCKPSGSTSPSRRAGAPHRLCGKFARLRKASPSAARLTQSRATRRRTRGPSSTRARRATRVAGCGRGDTLLRCPHLSIGFPYSNCINSCISRFPSA